MPEPATPGDDRCLAGLSAALTGLHGTPWPRLFAGFAEALAVDAVLLLGAPDPPLVRFLGGKDRRVPAEGELPATCLTALADGRVVRGGGELAAALVRPQGEPGSVLIAPLPGGPPLLALALYTNLSKETWTSGQEHALRGFAAGLAGWLEARDLQAVLDAVPQRIAWKDANLRYRGANLAFTRASRHPIAIGRPDLETDAHEREVLTTGRPLGPRLEVTALPGGREQWSWVSRTPQAGGVVVVRDDVTATVALASQLAQAQRTAAIGRLAAGVGSDLRPIAARIAADVSAARLDPADAPSALERIDLAAQTADDLARQLTAFARRQLPQPADIVPVQLLTRMEPTLDRLLGERIELRLAPVGLRCTARVDPRLFEQLLAMLARHVREHLRGRGRLDIDVAADTLGPADALPLALPAGEYVRVRLLATPGPPLDDAAFEADPPHADHQHGLRLALVRAIAGQAGGGVAHHTLADATVQLDIRLPRVFTVRHEPEARPIVDIRGGETLLLVDDDPVVRPLIATVLRHLGYHVIVSDELEAAASQLAETGPNGQVATTRVALALVSASLPEPPATALRRLRAAAPELRVLWISLHAPHGSPSVPAASDPLVVPCSFEALAVRVRQALDARA